MIPFPVAVLGMGLNIGPNRLTAESFASLACRLSARNEKEDALVRNLVRRSGVSERSVVLDPGADETWPFYQSGGAGPGTMERMRAYEQHAPALAHGAAASALTMAAVEGSSITHLVTVSCTGFSAPGIDLRLIQSLGLPSATERLHIGFMGCHGGINGLRAAHAIATANPNARILLVCVELCSLHFQYGMDRDTLLPNALFSDGAAALVLKQGTAPLCLLGTGSRVLPQSDSLMSWRIGDHGFRMTLDAAVPDTVGSSLRRFIEEESASAPMPTHWAIHPGGPRVVDSVAKSLGLGSEATVPALDVLRRHGNMSSSTVFFVLKRLLDANAQGPIGALAFGPGLTAEYALFEAR